MKKLIFILILIPSLTLSQQKTFVPDDDFELSLINLGIDNVVDDSVLTSSIDTVTVLYLGFFISNISDLTGIEDFISLIDLTIWYQNLTNIDVSYNTLLESLNCSGNQITNLDLSNNSFLINLECSSNLLTSLDLRNGNNTNMINFSSSNNPNLTCINVDDSTYSSNNLSYNIDPQQYFSNNCIVSTSISEYNTNKKLLKSIDVFGREILPKANIPLFYIYNNGKVEKKIIIK